MTEAQVLLGVFFCLLGFYRYCRTMSESIRDRTSLDAGFKSVLLSACIMLLGIGFLASAFLTYKGIH